MPRNTSASSRISLIQGLLFTFCFLTTTSIVRAQPGQQGSSRIIQDPRVDRLLEKHVKANEIKPAIEGYRIQIFFESGNFSKKMARDVREKFLINHPDMKAYILFQEPYYKVRAGDFRSRLEAEKALSELSGEYPNAFIVQDQIGFPRL